ncbi:MAG: hypothetical protein RJB01_1867 [Actinomycetota bacterium]
MVQVPVLLLSTPTNAPALALGTNKVASIFGTFSATASYLRKIKPDFATALPMAIAAFIAAAIGANIAVNLKPQIITWIIIIALGFAWLFIVLRPSLGMEQDLRWAGRKRHVALATVAGVAIGFYDGLVGPGTGTFLILALVAGLGYSFLDASVMAKIVNLGTNIAAIVVFGISGAILWQVGLTMAVFNVAGAILGAHSALRWGNKYVRVVFLVIAGGLLLRLLWGQLVG